MRLLCLHSAVSRLCWRGKEMFWFCFKFLVEGNWPEFLWYFWIINLKVAYLTHRLLQRSFPFRSIAVIKFYYRILFNKSPVILFAFWFWEQTAKLVRCSDLGTGGYCFTTLLYSFSFKIFPHWITALCFIIYLKSLSVKTIEMNVRIAGITFSLIFLVDLILADMAEKNKEGESGMERTTGQWALGRIWQLEQHSFAKPSLLEKSLVNPYLLVYVIERLMFEWFSAY